MKLFGKLMAGIVLMVLVGLSISFLVQLSTNNNKNTSTTLSIQEARELVDKVYTACKGDSGSLAPAAVYEKEYVDGKFASMALGTLEEFNEILKKCDGETGKVKFPSYGAEAYVSYQLTENGVKCEMVWINDNKISSRQYANLYYENKNEDLWAFTLSMIRSSSGTFNNDETKESFNEYVDKVDYCGTGKKLLKCQGGTTMVDQSFFGTNTFNKDNVMALTFECLDAINHEQLKKGYRVNESVAKEVDWAEYENLTDAEINQIASEIQNHVKANYTRQVTDLDKYIEIKQ